MPQVPQITVIETKHTPKAYGMLRTEIVIDHPKHGRLLLVEGWGGDGIEGQQYRWKHGNAFRLLPEDTLETLKTTERGTLSGLPSTQYDVMIHGYDETRPSLMWEGYMVEKMAARALTAPASLATRA